MKSLAVNKNIHYRLQFYSFVTFSKLFKKMRPKNPTQLLKKNSAKFKSNNFFEHYTNSDISINHNFFHTKGSFFTCLLPLVLKITYIVNCCNMLLRFITVRWIWQGVRSIIVWCVWQGPQLIDAALVININSFGCSALYLTRRTGQGRHVSCIHYPSHHDNGITLLARLHPVFSYLASRNVSNGISLGAIFCDTCILTWWLSEISSLANTENHTYIFSHVNRYASSQIGKCFYFLFLITKEEKCIYNNIWHCLKYLGRLR